jgi:hypothetical protein
MKIKYLGPGSFVNIAPYDRHEKGEIKEYPDDFGKELIATSKAQKFEVVKGPVDNSDMADITPRKKKKGRN